MPVTPLSNYEGATFKRGKGLYVVNRIGKSRVHLTNSSNGNGLNMHKSQFIDEFRHGTMRVHSMNNEQQRKMSL